MLLRSLADGKDVFILAVMGHGGLSGFPPEVARLAFSIAFRTGMKRSMTSGVVFDFASVLAFFTALPVMGGHIFDGDGSDEPGFVPPPPRVMCRQRGTYPRSAAAGHAEITGG